MSGYEHIETIRNFIGVNVKALDGVALTVALENGVIVATLEGKGMTREATIDVSKLMTEVELKEELSILCRKLNNNYSMFD